MTTLYKVQNQKKVLLKKILVCYKTDEILYDDLKEQLGNGILFFKSVEEFPSVDEFRDAIDVDYKEQYLIYVLMIVFITKIKPVIPK